VGVREDAGERYLIPAGGVLEVGGLPEGFVNVVAYRRAGSGEWDPTAGGARYRVAVHEGSTAELGLAALETYPEEGSVLAGRVFRQPGVALGGVAVVAISRESGELVGTVATSDGGGFWSVEMPEDGLGGDLFVHDSTWGSVPVVGMPYSDIVLGARAYSGWMEEFAPEAWRTGSLGHKNFAYVPDAVWVVDNESGEVFGTEEAPGGGWITSAALAKFAFVEDPVELVAGGPRLRSYRLETDHGVEDPEWHLRGQSFGGADGEASNYRATGYYPEKKLLFGGKIKYNVLRNSRTPVTEELAEAARVGLEFGEHQAFVELRTGEQIRGIAATAVSDWLCPYCGGPLARGPREDGAPRGFCRPCSEAFGLARAMDGRSFARSITVAARPERRWVTRAVALTTTGGFANLARYQWRPDLYEENDGFIVSGGPGQATNAPRWWARHPHEVGDGRGLGRLEGAIYTAGHELEYYAALVGRRVGLAQLKLAFPAGWVAQRPFTVAVDCVREDGGAETLRMRVPGGTRGPNAAAPLGDVAPLRPTPKLRAEGLGSPYLGVGLYRAVTGMRLVEAEDPADCRCVVTTDVPFLHDPAGLIVPPAGAEFVALQLVPPQGRPHLLEDAVGQLFLLQVREGNVELRRRRALSLGWEAPRTITGDGNSDYPWAAKDQTGRMILVRQRGEETVIAHSRNDGETWEEI
jgi:hypothetical protein